jgi:hypothetical protein
MKPAATIAAFKFGGGTEELKEIAHSAFPVL